MNCTVIVNGVPCGRPGRPVGVTGRMAECPEHFAPLGVRDGKPVKEKDAGNCFEVAWEAITDPAAPPSAVLVHGLPIGRGVHNAGQRYWHAWIEVFEFGLGWIVLDYSNGQQLQMKRRDFYHLGHLTDANVYRYSKHAARAAGLEHEHVGPWVDGWEGMGL